MGLRFDTEDPGFVRIRTSSDRTDFFMEKYAETKKLERFEVTPGHAGFGVGFGFIL